MDTDQVVSGIAAAVQEQLRVFVTPETEEERSLDLSEEVSQSVNQSEEIKEVKSVDSEECEKVFPQLIIDEKFTTLVHSSTPTGIRSASKPVKKIFTALTKDISSFLGTELETSEVLPRNTRFYASRRDTKLFVIEEEPCIRTVRTNLSFESVVENLRLTGKLREFGYENFLQDGNFIDGKKEGVLPEERNGLTSGGTVYRFNVSFPYIVYIVSYSESNYFHLSIYYRTSPLSSLKDLLFKCNLLNIDGRDVCCLGSYDIPAKVPINEKASLLIDRFWNSTFNTEIVENFNMYRSNPHLCSFLHWHYYSEDDPSFILSENFLPVSASKPDLKSVIEYKFSCANSFDEFTTHHSIARLLGYNQLPKKIQQNQFTTVFQIVLDPNRGITLDSGEEVIINEKKYYVVSFLTNNSGTTQEMTVEDEQHNVKKFRLTKKLIDILVQNIQSRDQIESYEVSGTRIKSGDLIGFPEQKHLTSVSKIFKDRDGTILAKCGSDYYILENLEFNIMSEDQIMFNGVHLKKKEKYFLFRGENYLPNLLEGSLTKRSFEGIVNIGIDELFFKFSGNSMDLSLEEMYRYKIFEEKDVEVVPVTRYGIKLFTNTSVIKKTNLYVEEHGTRIKVDVIKEECEKIIEDKKLSIPSFDFDINLQVGDKVIVPDWSRATEMTCIKTIIDFEQSVNDLIVVTTDDSGNITKTPYINSRRGIIFTGAIRKISTEFNGIKSGFKMIAKTKIGNFLKKDCHQVIGFLMDTSNSVPLMLCSNLCTVWATEENINCFNFLDPSSRNFSKFQTSPLIVSDIKLQSGDLINSMKNDICCSQKVFFALSRIFKSAQVLRCESNYSCCRCAQVASSPYSFYGILNPRFSIKPKLEEEGFEKVPVIPSFHNTYVRDKRRNQLPIWVRKEEIFDVSNLSDGQEEA